MARINFEQLGYDCEGDPQYGIRSLYDTVISTTSSKYPLMHKVCQLVGYKHQKITLVPAHSVQLINSEWSGMTRVRYRMVDIETMEILASPESDCITINLSPTMVVTASAVIRGYEQPLGIYLHPDTLSTLGQRRSRARYSADT